MKQLTKQQEKRIKEIYNIFEYLLDQKITAYKDCLKIFKKDRNLNSTELKLVVLHNLFNYEYIYRLHKPLIDIITLDYGLLGMFGAYEQLRELSRFEDLVIELNEIEVIWTETRGY